MNDPLVSVCVVSHNHVNFIGEALNSALSQDYPNLEVVVADDASTDGTPDVILDYTRQYPGRVIFLPSESNQGFIANGNRVLHVCRGKYLAFLDGDDVFLPNKIAKQVAWLEADERRVLCGHDVDVFESCTGKSMYMWSDRFKMRQGQGARDIVRYIIPFCTVSIMVRAAAAPAHGFEERMKIVVDWNFWIDCTAGGGHFGYLDAVLARYRRHPNNVTARASTDEAIHRVSFTDTLVTLSLVEANYPHLIQESRYARARLFYSEGVWQFLQGNRRLARTYLSNSLRHAFVSWKVPMWLLFSMLPNRAFENTLVRFTLRRS